MKKGRKRTFALLALILALVFTVTACGSGSTGSGSSGSSSGADTSSASSAGLILTADDINIKDSDTYTADWQDEDYVTITGSGDSAESDSSDGVEISGADVTITKKGTYVLTGTFNGSVTVNADDKKVHLILNGAEITSDDGPAVNVTAADKVTISTVKDTENTITDSTDGYDENVDAAVYSKGDLVLNGEGTLNVTGNYKDAVHSTDDLRITGGTYNITAAGHGLVGRDRLEITDGTFTIKADGKGLKTTNEDDADKGFIYISGGTFDISSEDDAINAVSAVWITSGTFNLTSGDDGIHADETLTVDGGEITVAQCYEGIEAPEIYINDGKLSITASDDGINAAGGGTEEDSDSAANPSTAASNTSAESSSDSGTAPTLTYISFGDTAAAETTAGPGGMPGGNNNNNENGGIGSGRGNGWMDRGGAPEMGGGGMESTSTGYLTITGGTIYVNADGDGIDANTDITQTGGDIIVEGPTMDGNGALDYGGTYKMTGGTLMAFGSTGMLQSISDSSSVNGLTVCFGSSVSAGTEVALKDSSGKEILSYTTTKSAASVVLASPDLKDGETYTVCENGTEAGTATLSGTVTKVNV